MAILAQSRCDPLLLLWLFCWSALFAPPASAQISREYDVKAVFLFNFAQYVEWPRAALPDQDTPFIIGVLGSTPLSRSLEEVVRNETVRNRKIVVLPYRRVEEIQTCHILFISPSETPRLPHILDTLQGRPVLTVSEIEGFGRRGGIIRFFLESGKVRLHINNGAARAAHLIISPRLLRLAEQVMDNDLR